MQHSRRLSLPVISLVLAALLSSGAAALAGPGPGAFDESMYAIMAGYLKIQEQLAADSIEGVAEEAQSLAAKASGLDASHVGGEHAAHYKGLPIALEKAARALGEASSIEEAREAFEDLSRPMAMWATVSRPPGVSVVFCSMAKASWLQREGEVRNPYYGKAMLNCGEIMSEAGHSAGPAEDGEAVSHPTRERAASRPR